MERYDGKTKKDDYKKYALIAAGVVAVIALYYLLTGVIYRVSHPTPDAVVVIGCEAVIDFQMEDGMEADLKALATDLDGNGKTVVDVVPYDTRTNSAMDGSGVGAVGAQDGKGLFQTDLAEGNGLIFISTSRTDFGEEYCLRLPEEMTGKPDSYCVEITECEMITALGFKRGSFYAAIAKDTGEAERELALEMLGKLKTA